MKRYLVPGLFLSSVAAAQIPAEMAILIVDMQPHFVERFGFHQFPTNHGVVEGVIERQCELALTAKKHHAPLWLIRYLGGPGVYGKLRRITQKYRIGTLPKDQDDAFEMPQVRNALAGFKVKSIILAGANGNACIHSTMLGALKLGLQVYLWPDAVVDFNCDQFIWPFGLSQFVPEKKELLPDQGIYEIESIRPWKVRPWRP